MIERRPWGASDQQFQQMKRRSTATWATCWTVFSPSTTREYEGKRVQLRLECAEAAPR